MWPPDKGLISGQVQLQHHTPSNIGQQQNPLEQFKFLMTQRTGWEVHLSAKHIENVYSTSMSFYVWTLMTSNLPQTLPLLTPNQVLFWYPAMWWGSIPLPPLLSFTFFCYPLIDFCPFPNRLPFLAFPFPHHSPLLCWSVTKAQDNKLGVLRDQDERNPEGVQRECSLKDKDRGGLQTNVVLFPSHKSAKHSDGIPSTPGHVHPLRIP